MDEFERELAAVGVIASGPWDLVNSRRPYPTAIPILIKWLASPLSELPPSRRERFREGLVRALSVREARPAAAVALVNEFHRPGASDSYRWAVGNALSVVSDDSVADALLEIAEDREYGMARQMVVSALPRLSDSRVVPVLIELLRDPTVVRHALTAVARLRAREARSVVEELTHSPHSALSRAAQRTLARLS